MSSQTPNYNLVKPAYEDTADIAVAANGNMDIIDTALAAHDTAISGKAAKGDAVKNITRSGTTFTATRANNTTFTFDQQDTNTWRGIQDNLTSTSATDSLSAKQGKVLNDKINTATAGYKLVATIVAGTTTSTGSINTGISDNGNYIIAVRSSSNEEPHISQYAGTYWITNVAASVSRTYHVFYITVA